MRIFFVETCMFGYECLGIVHESITSVLGLSISISMNF
jgi:hypothetical protein